MTLEELLNKLLESGWKPFDVDVKIKRAKCFHSVHFIVRPLVNFVLEGYAEATVPLRELVSKESGLWQFVCENGMVNINNEFDYEEWGKYYKWNGDENEHTHIFSRHCDSFWLIESALCDEDELEQFLLDNIKIDEKYTEEEQELIDLDYGTGYTKKFVK